MVRKASMMAAAGLMVLGALASPASAQNNVTVNIKSTEVFANNIPGRGTGGGWNATITGGVQPTFILGSAGLPVVYCFDFNRQFAFNSNRTMTLLSFSDFIAGNPSPAISPWGNINIDDLNNMAFLASGYTAGSPNDATIRAGNTTIQNDIWNLAAGTTNAAAGFPDLSESWMVLVDAQDWAGTGSASRTDGTQSFLVRVQKGSVVPEPSSMVLLVAGFGAVAVFSRRRRDTVA